MSLSIAEWHQRYTQQAGWSAELRRLVFSFDWFNKAQSIIELGCGTGAILQELLPSHRRCVVGLDIESEPLIYASSINNTPRLVQADAYSTPFPDSAFDISFCHFLLLWVKHPHCIISEMIRITKPGGWILAFAEPDYGGRIDFPNELASLGNLQTESLIKQGANPYTGRTIRSLFSSGNIKNVVSGIFGAQWSSSFTKMDDMEMLTLQSDYDLLGNSPQSIPQDQFFSLRQKDNQSWENKTRVLFVPTFYAWGQIEK